MTKKKPAKEKTPDPNKSKEARIKRTVDIFFYLLEHEPQTNAQILEQFKSTFSKGSSTKSNQKAITRVMDNLNMINSESTLFNDFFTFEKINSSTHTVKLNRKLNEQQILLLSKLLLSSRALNQAETKSIIKNMENTIDVEDREVVKAAIDENKLNEPYLSNKSDRLTRLWVLEKCIHNSKRITFDYINHEPSKTPQVEHVTMLPKHVLFDNYYLFLVGYSKIKAENGEFKVERRTYRLDWMQKANIKVTKENQTDDEAIQIVKETIEVNDRIDHSLEDRKNVFAYQGKETTITFKYYGYLEYLKDKFPQADVLSVLNEPNQFDFPVTKISLKVNYSDGVKLWLLGETPIIKILDPYPIALDIAQTLKRRVDSYQDILSNVEEGKKND